MKIESINKAFVNNEIYLANKLDEIINQLNLLDITIDSIIQDLEDKNISLEEDIEYPRG